MERLKRNPGAWGLLIGGAVIAVSTLMNWFTYTNPSSGASSDLRLIQSVSGGTVLMIGFLVALCGLGVTASGGGGRFLWGGLGLLMAAIVLGIAIWGLVSPESASAVVATTQSLSKLALPGAIESASDTATKALDDGTITASAQIGLFVGLIGGLIGTLGGLFSFRKKRPAVE